MFTATAIDRLATCRECPRGCGVNRLQGPTGFCATGAGFSVGAVCRHRGEEPVFGEEGVCNVFFTLCNLQCRYCQNYQISRKPRPDIAHELTLPELVGRIRRILAEGVRHVGFVSPSHVFPQMEALMEELAGDRPAPVFVMNTNGYDLAEQIRRLAGRMHVYLPDLKYMDPDLSRRYSGCPDYPAVAQAALREMFRQKGPELVLDDQGVIESGLIIRHLVLPGQVENSKAALRFIARELSPEITISLMAQYMPIPAVADDPELGRRLSSAEYGEVLEELDRLGMENGWVQDLASQDYYCPDFALSHPFEQ
ncbi:MAG: radical SAM protein [Desulfobulbus sp.]|nr:MAG: radical SAM protein [Desulfobulbus sp.]